MFDIFISKCNHIETALHCQVPSLLPINSSVKISFNGADWSIEKFYLPFVNTQLHDDSIYFTSFIAASLLAAYIITMWPKKSRLGQVHALKEAGANSHSRLPSIKKLSQNPEEDML